MAISFEWDPSKARGNLRKHGITFHEAATVFADPLARIFDDPDHSNREPREILIGHSARGTLLVVSFFWIADTIRIISARKATSRERQDYEESVSS